MRVVAAGFAIVLVALLVLAAGSAALANGGTKVFQISCLPEIDLFELQDLGYVDEPADLFDGSGVDLTGEKPVLYAPERHADFSGSDFLIAEGVLENPNYGIHPTRFECRLRAGLVELVALPEPLLRIQYLSADDIAITLRVAGRLLLEDVPFAPCGDRGPITRLAYDGASGLVHLYGRFSGGSSGEADPSEAGDHATRDYYFDGQGLSVWNDEAQGQNALPAPLSAEDIDYDLSSSRDPNWTIRDCRYRGPGAPAKRLIPP